MVDVLGECPVPKAMKHDGHNDGIGAGRACWMVQPFTCLLKSSQRQPSNPCYDCSFYKRVVFEERENMQFRFSLDPTHGRSLPHCTVDKILS